MSNIRPLTPELAKRAQKELGEVPERIDADIQQLRDWIVKQPHLNARTDDQLLVAFLRGCKYSVEKAKHKFDNYYAMRGAVPELYKDRFVTDAAIDILHSRVYVPLRKPVAPDGPRIHLSCFGLFNTNKYSLSDTMKVRTLIADIQFYEDDNAMVAGFMDIVDFQGVGAGHIFLFNPVLVKKLAVLGDKAWPHRPKGVHFINVSSSCEKLMSMAKSLMNDKIKQRFHVHSNYESLYKHIPKECLPTEYGGSNGSIAEEVKQWEKKLLSYKEYFVEDAKYGTNEKLRRGRPINAETLFGIDGSFRKLDID